jgi:hypothetical protein
MVNYALCFNLLSLNTRYGADQLNAVSYLGEIRVDEGII